MSLEVVALIGLYALGFVAFYYYKKQNRALRTIGMALKIHLEDHDDEKK